MSKLSITENIFQFKIILLSFLNILSFISTKYSLFKRYEGVYVTIVHPAFCFFLYLTGVHFRGDLQHGGDVIQQKISKKSVSTNQNSRDRWCLIVRCRICYGTLMATFSTNTLLFIFQHFDCY